MTKKTFVTKENGNTLEASEWNELTGYINEAVDAINAIPAGGSPSSSDTSGVVSVNAKGNTTISATKHINIEPAYDTTGSTSGTYGDVQIKPGDDITLESHHRAINKRDEITIKTSNGLKDDAKAPVKLQVIAADMTLSTKGKKVETGSNDSSNVMNVNVTTGNGKGYLKVRAQAIDLRCEEHGGIALQPMGKDSQNHMNKIKFEHGGGDGLEFGTFNTEKTSIFTDEYRFNKDGVWKMATREKLDNSSDLEGTVGVTIGNKKYVSGTSDETQHYSYKKQADDFYDIISGTDEQCTTKDIIKTAYAMNGKVGVHTKITNKGALEIATSDQYVYLGSSSQGISLSYIQTINVGSVPTFTVNEGYSESELNDVFNDLTLLTNIQSLEDEHYVGITAHSDLEGEDTVCIFLKHSAPNIKIDSGAELKLGGILDFGSSFNFGETDNGIQTQYKLTKKNSTKDCSKLQVVAVNNHASNPLSVTTYTASHGKTLNTVNPGASGVIAECSLLDIINFITWAKANNYGYWDPNNASSSVFNNVIGEGSQAENPGGEVATEEQTPGEEVPSGN